MGFVSKLTQAHLVMMCGCGFGKLMLLLCNSSGRGVVLKNIHSDQ